MEYYPLKDEITGQYWKLKVDDEKLCLEENSKAESGPNPGIGDKDGSVWVLSVNNGFLTLTSATTQPVTYFRLHDPDNNVWRVIADHGVIGIEQTYEEESANIRIVYNNTEFDSATVTATSEASGFPVSNLQDQRRKKVWRSTSVSDQHISIDFGSGGICANCVVLINHNLTYEGKIGIIATDSPDYESSPKLYTWIWAWETTWGFGESGFGEHGFGGVPLPSEIDELFPGVIRIHYFPATSARYWRLYFEDDDNPDGYIEVGRLFLTRYFEPSYNFVWGWKFLPYDRTKVKYTRGGQPVTYVLEKRYKVNFKFEWIEKDEAWIYFIDIIRRFGIRKDIVIDMFPYDASVKGIFARLYGRFEEVPELIEGVAVDTVSLSFIESL